MIAGRCCHLLPREQLKRMRARVQKSMDCRRWSNNACSGTCSMSKHCPRFGCRRRAGDTSGLSADKPILSVQRLKDPLIYLVVRLLTFVMQALSVVVVVAVIDDNVLHAHTHHQRFNERSHGLKNTRIISTVQLFNFSINWVFQSQSFMLNVCFVFWPFVREGINPSLVLCLMLRAGWWS